MSRKRTAMYGLQELVRLHRLKAGHREVARILKMGPNTERKYRLALEDAALLHGSADDLSVLEELKAAVLERLPPGTTPQQVSSAEPWLEDIRKMVEKGASPKAIFDRLRLEYEGFAASLWPARRLCRRIKKLLPVRPAHVSDALTREKTQSVWPPPARFINSLLDTARWTSRIRQDRKPWPRPGCQPIGGEYPSGFPLVSSDGEPGVGEMVVSELGRAWLAALRAGVWSLRLAR